MSLVFATNNSHKLEEARRIIGDAFDIVSLADIGCDDDIPEDAPTLEGNAIAKARWIKQRYGYDCFADDTGLEVDALGGLPGVRTARYAGDAHDSGANMRLLLQNLKGCSNRKACFRTAVALILDDKEYCFEGRVDGLIAQQPEGSEGFGYDPVFVPDDFPSSFATLSPDVKNSISHRGRALAAMLDFLNSYLKKTENNA
ncbi:MAG: non-canonical purine NTP diphosphatase [Muribaculaceae bacterium]|nr:non-canonical purine NTP diphosphatase [Muribaculaceae bacterium]